MITREDFLKLRNGDLILWETPSGRKYFRTVQTGPRDHPMWNDWRSSGWVCHVTFAKRCMTRYPSPVTGYNFTDLRDKIYYTGRRNTDILLTPEEIERMFASGFKISESLKFELRQRQDHPCSRMEILGKDRHWRNRVKRTFRTLKEIGL